MKTAVPRCVGATLLGSRPVAKIISAVCHGVAGTKHYKIVSGVKVHDISSEDFVERDLMLLKVRCTSVQRTEIVLLVEMFRGRVVDISTESIMVEISGREQKIETFIELMRPYGIQELARTGRIALVRGQLGQGDVL